jgi:Fuc2NAc and GlcNAc transferase
VSGSVNAEATLVVLGCLVLACLLTGWVRKLALSAGVLDVPNDRSSHVVPTPRGGGIAVVIATTLGIVAFWLLGTIDLNAMVALVGGGLAIALIGYLDDRYRLPARTRLAVHFMAALWALAWLGGLPPIQFGTHIWSPGWGGYVVGAVGIVWTLNLFNFMDGIDGIAGSEAVFIAAAAAFIQWHGAGSVAPSWIASAFGAASLGFLLWNWPPAKIFMGDAGSGYMGYAVALMALIAARTDPVALLVYVILGGLFFVDATVTLVRRVARKERASEAHRSHAYQWLARRWGSHRSVTLLVLGINVLWLLPCAYFAAVHARLAGWTVVAALLPLMVGAFVAGAGRSEKGTK